MNNKIIDGKKLAKEHEEILRKRIEKLGKKPHIVSLLVGDNPGSLLYSNLKQKKATDLKIEFEIERFAEDATWQEIEQEINHLNHDDEIDGIMVQLPLPDHFLGNNQTSELLDQINPRKDVDGLTSHSLVPQAAVRGIISILESEKVNFQNRKIVVVGAKGMVGSELVQKLKDLGVSVEKVDRLTDNPCDVIGKADVIISAVGQKNLITADCIKVGATIVDIGGDVDFENVQQKVSRITPPRGGVGPMTVISLMENVVELAERKNYQHGFNG